MQGFSISLYVKSPKVSKLSSLMGEHHDMFGLVWSVTNVLACGAVHDVVTVFMVAHL
jgi:hypothetical protein